MLKDLRNSLSSTISKAHKGVFMFGWGRKKEIKETKIENSGNPAAPVNNLASIPIAVFVGVANSENQIERVQNIIEARANSIKEVTSYQTAIDELGIATSLMVDINTNAVFTKIHEAAHILAGELSLLAACYLVRCDENGAPIETLHIEAKPFEPSIKEKKGLFDGLKRTSSKIAGGIGSIFTKAKLDDDALNELEDLLIMSDMGVEVARKIRGNLENARFDKGIDETSIKEALAKEIEAHLSPFEKFDNPWEGAQSPRVIMFVGVNGSGKTTTIGKIAQNLVDNGHDIMLAAADTFRAAASEQLLVWGKRANVEVIAKESGADSAGLAFEALQKAKAQNKDVLLIDTAGRLQNKAELMAELEKIVRVLKKQDENAPHEVWLVLDATVGQNAISQAEAFSKAANVTGLIMSKLDGTAKGGVLLALSDKYRLPIRFIGIGEKTEDLQPFSAHNFSRALVGLEG